MEAGAITAPSPDRSLKKGHHTYDLYISYAGDMYRTQQRLFDTFYCW